MTPALEVRDLVKTYPGFALDRISFALAPGRVTGFIGRNGAGKTTALKCILGLLHRDGGEITFWGQLFAGREEKIKQDIGYVPGGFRFYSNKSLRAITAVTRGCYRNWDQSAYERLLGRFSLEERKSPRELSEGMKVKYALTLALSHGAKLLILDEPTSGLDPVSRDELLELFLDLRDQGVTIFFSTHITSDLTACADDLIYIRGGKLRAQEPLEAFQDRYRLVRLAEAREDPALLGLRREKAGCSALIAAKDARRFPQAEKTDLETIMIHLEREAQA